MIYPLFFFLQATISIPRYIVTVWIVMNPAARFHFHVFFFLSFFFFFPCMWTVTSHEFTVQGTKITIYALFITVHNTVHALKNIKNGPHSTIYTFKNYFATVLSVLVSTTISSIQTDPLRLDLDPRFALSICIFFFFF